MTLDEAIERLKTHIGKACNLQEDWKVDIYLWERTELIGLLGIRVAEVSLSTHMRGESWMQSDVPHGLAVCAQAERCLLAYLRGEDEDIDEELAYLDALIVHKDGSSAPDTEYVKDEPIGYTITTGNLTDGFFLNGFFKTNEDACEHGNTNAHLDDTWCVTPIYSVEK